VNRKIDQHNKKDWIISICVNLRLSADNALIPGTAPPRQSHVTTEQSRNIEQCLWNNRQRKFQPVTSKSNLMRFPEGETAHAVDIKERLEYSFAVW